MERRVEQAHGHRKAVHGLEDPDEIAALQRRQRVVCLLLFFGRLREDHLPDGGDPLLPEEHVLRPAQTDALGTSRPSVGRLVGGVGVGAHPKATGLVGPLHERLERLPYLLFPGLGIALDRPGQRRLLEVQAPSWTRLPSTENELAPRSIRIASAPHTAGMPSPRATTAAWEFVPPALVRIPCDLIIPW